MDGIIVLIVSLLKCKLPYRRVNSSPFHGLEYTFLIISLYWAQINECKPFECALRKCSSTACRDWKTVGPVALWQESTEISPTSFRRQQPPPLPAFFLWNQSLPPCFPLHIHTLQFRLLSQQPEWGRMAGGQALRSGEERPHDVRSHSLGSNKSVVWKKSQIYSQVLKMEMIRLTTVSDCLFRHLMKAELWSRHKRVQ